MIYQVNYNIDISETKLEIFNKNIFVELLEASKWDASNEYRQYTDFCPKIKKNPTKWFSFTYFRLLKYDGQNMMGTILFATLYW